MIPPGSYDPSAPFSKRFEQIDRAPLCLKAKCVAHGKLCPLFSRTADLEVAGLPCVDFSKAGLQLKEEGPTSPIFCCHAKVHAEKMTPVIILENVPETCLAIYVGFK